MRSFLFPQKYPAYLTSFTWILLSVHMLTSFSVEEILQPRYMNWSTNVRDLLFKEEMTPMWLK